MTYIRIGNIIHPMLNVINPLAQVDIYYNNGYAVDSSGLKSDGYTRLSVMARVQSIDQKLLNQNDVQLGQVFKRFFFLTEDLRTVDRNLGTDGDYLFYNTLYYKITSLPGEYLTGWQEVEAQQTSGLGE